MECTSLAATQDGALHGIDAWNGRVIRFDDTDGDQVPDAHAVFAQAEGREVWRLTPEILSSTELRVTAPALDVRMVRRHVLNEASPGSAPTIRLWFDSED